MCPNCYICNCPHIAHQEVYICPHTTTCVCVLIHSYIAQQEVYMCPHTTLCVCPLILLYSSTKCLSALILLHVYLCVCVLILLHSSTRGIYVPSYYYISVLILLYMRPHTAVHVPRERACWY
jgi:hypothetical protein